MTVVASNSSWLLNHLEPLVHLPLYLLDNQCKEGAIEVADLICRHLTTSTCNSNVFVMSKSQTESFVRMVIFLQADDETAKPQRVGSLIGIFSRLLPFQQCIAIIAADKAVQGVGSLLAAEAAKCLCRIFPLIFYLSNRSSGLIWPRVGSVIGKVVEIYLKLGDQHLLQLVIDKITDWDAGGKRIELIEKILCYSEGMFSTESGRQLQNQLIRSQVSSFAEIAKENEENEEFQNSLASFVLRVMRMELNPQLASPHRVESLTKLFDDLSNQCLCQLINDLRSAAPPSMVGYFSPPTSSKRPSERDFHSSHLKIITSLLGNIGKDCRRNDNEFVRKFIVHKPKMLFNTLYLVGWHPVVLAYFLKAIFRTFLDACVKPEGTAFNTNCLLLLKDILILDGLWSTLAESESQHLILDVSHAVLSGCTTDLAELSPDFEVVENSCKTNVICACIELLVILDKTTFPAKSKYVDWQKKQKEVQCKFYEKLYQVCTADSVDLKNCDTPTVLDIFHYALQFTDNHSLLSAFTKKIIDAHPVTGNNPLLQILFHPDGRLWKQLEEFQDSPTSLLLTSQKYESLLLLLSRRISAFESQDSRASIPEEKAKLEEFATFLEEKMSWSSPASCPPAAKKSKIDDRNSSSGTKSKTKRRL